MSIKEAYLSHTFVWWVSLHPGNRLSSSAQCLPYKERTRRDGGSEERSLLGAAPSANVGGKSKSECHNGKRQEKMRNILSSFKKKEKTTDIRKCGKSWLLRSDRIWTVDCGRWNRCRVIHNHLPVFFFFFRRLLKAGIRAHREIAKSGCLSDAGIQCLIQRPQKACISIKIYTHIEMRGWKDEEKTEKERKTASERVIFALKKVPTALCKENLQRCTDTLYSSLCTASLRTDWQANGNAPQNVRPGKGELF